MDDRYHRQIAFAPLGAAGQDRLRAASVLVAGCGGLGSASASALVRAGVGRVRVVDKDRIELSNLHRQLLYDEEDLGLPKAEAAGRKLRRIDGAAIVEALAVEIDRSNVERLIADVSLVLDGTDNLTTRYLLNEACVKHGKTWIYAGVSGAIGALMTIVPGQGACLRCVFPDAMTVAPEQRLPVLGPVPAAIASMQAVEACKVLSGADPSGALLSFDLWSQVFRRIEVARDPGCPTCALRRFELLEG